MSTNYNFHCKFGGQSTGTITIYFLYKASIIKRKYEYFSARTNNKIKIIQ